MEVEVNEQQPEREDVVRTLAHAAHKGMEKAVEDNPDATAAEVFSAYLTLTATIIKVMQDMKVPNRTIRTAVEKLLLRCPSDTGSVN